MGEGVRHHLTARLLLQAVITDGAGRVEGFFQVAGLQPVMPALRVMRPDSGQAVGLQFLAHQQAAIAFDPLAALARRVDLGRYAQQGLYVMATSWAIT